MNFKNNVLFTDIFIRVDLGITRKRVTIIRSLQFHRKLFSNSRFIIIFKKCTFISSRLALHHICHYVLKNPGTLGNFLRDRAS